MMDETYTFYAFISYRSTDEKWARWLQDKLESYRLPTALSKKHAGLPKKIKPCFRYHTDIQPNELKEELRNKLSQSKYLIVICSPHSASSRWVGNEIETFVRLGRRDRIIPFIVGGLPYSGNPSTECYHPILHRYFPHTDNVETDCELLGVNIHEEGRGSRWMKRKRALVQLISKMLDVSFDELWNRERQRYRRRMFVRGVCLLLLVFLLWWVWRTTLPADISFTVSERSVHNPYLPSLDGVIVSLQADKEWKVDTVFADQGNTGRFFHVPSQLLGQDVRVKMQCPGWCPVDTVVVLKEHLCLAMQRDVTIYGTVRFTLWNAVNEQPVRLIKMKVQGKLVVTDTLGRVNLHIPLSEQRNSYAIEAEIPLENDSLYMPCGANDYVLVCSEE